MGGMAWFVLVAHVYRMDLDVYRIGVQTWLNGGDLYGKLPDTVAGLNLPFVYPPIAAALMMPLALVPFNAASITLTVLTIALLAVTLTIVLDALGLSRRWLVLVFPAALAMEPVWATLGFGQVNMILMALVAADCLTGKTRWPRGILVGLAAAIKLTPAAFLLFFLLRRDYRAALTATLAFLAATALGFVVSWQESLAFWTHEVFHTADKVGVEYIGKVSQSVFGVLTRMDAAEFGPMLAVGVICLAIAGMRRAEPALALAVNSMAMLLLSPISWSHHWVSCVLIVPAFAKNGMRLFAVTGAAMFLAVPYWWGIEPVTINAYPVYALLALAAVAVKMWRHGRLTAWTSEPSSRFLTPASTTGANSPKPSTPASVPATSQEASHSSTRSPSPPSKPATIRTSR